MSHTSRGLRRLTTIMALGGAGAALAVGQPGSTGRTPAPDDARVPRTVSRPSFPPRENRYVEVVVPAPQSAADQGATLSAEDLEVLRRRLRTHGFDIDDRTGRPLMHAPVPPPGIGVYYPFAYDPRLFGVEAYGTDARGATELYLAQREYERRDARRRFNQEDMTRRAHSLLTASERAVEQGLRLMKSGEFQRALIAFTLAAELDNGDPACRVHLAQARLALGHYAEAAQALRRALQLQPRLVYVQLDLDAHYPHPADFARDVEALSNATDDATSADVWFLLGFMEYQRGDFQAAYAAFSAADGKRPDDKLTRQFLQVLKPAAR